MKFRFHERECYCERYKPIEQIIENAATSVEMEGYTIDSKSKEWCQKLLRNEITMQEYISLVKKKAGVKA